MLEYKITEIIDAGLYTKDGEKILDLTAILKDALESSIIESENK